MRSRSALLLLVGFLSVSCTDKNIDVEGPPMPNLRSYLDANPNLKDNIKFEQDASPSYYYGGTLNELSYENWLEADKAALDASFERAWQWIYVSQQASILGEQEFSMPLSCTYCEGRLLTFPNNGPFTVIPEDFSKRAYIAFVAHSLALEAGGRLQWSILNSSANDLHHFLNSRSMMHRLGGTGEFFFGEPGGGGNARIKYLGRVSPATPIYAFKWLVANNILQSTQQATVLALLQWMRTHAVHFYGSATYQNMMDHWGYPAQTSAYHVMIGTVRATESEPQHWTAGCHGTAGFLKSVLKSVNIPVQPIFTCNHAQVYFPTLGLYMDHGDNPYNNNVIADSAKSISGVLIDQATHTGWFTTSPDYLDPANPACANIGRAATEF